MCSGGDPSERFAEGFYLVRASLRAVVKGIAESLKTIVEVIAKVVSHSLGKRLSQVARQ